MWIGRHSWRCRYSRVSCHFAEFRIPVELFFQLFERVAAKKQVVLEFELNRASADSEVLDCTAKKGNAWLGLIQPMARRQTRDHAICPNNIQYVQIFHDRGNQRAIGVVAAFAADDVGMADAKRGVMVKAKVFDARLTDTARSRQRHPSLHFDLMVGWVGNVTA